MSITFSGLATGMDTDSIVKQLMELERAPINRLETRKTSATERIEAYAQFKTTLDDLKTAASSMAISSQVRSTSISLGEGAPFTATSANGGTGSYNVAVKQLAQVQKSVTGGWSSQSEPLLGTGTFTLNNGTTDTVIEVTAGNNSLSGLAAAINEQSGATGVKATIINDGTTGSPHRLVFTGTDSSSTFTISSNLVGADGTTPVPLATTQTQTAQQAKVMIDGIEVVSNSNTISGAIAGITLNLNGVSDIVTPAAEGSPAVYKSALLDVQADSSALKEKLTTFVTSYNKVMEWINSGYDIPAATAAETSKDDAEEVKLLGAVLRGDSSINSVKRGLQSMLSSMIKTSGSISTLAELGITTQRDGTLYQNNSKMDEALKDNFDGVVSLLAGEGSTDGIMKKFNYFLLDQTSGTNGLYANKKKSYDLSVKRIDDQILNMDARMSQREASLRAQYTAMEQLVSGLNAQGSFLTQQMDMLSNMLNRN